MNDRTVTRIDPLPKPSTFKEAVRAVQKVAAYARVSTDHEDQRTSLSAQTDYYKKKILEHPGWEFVKIYVDDGVSGLNTNHRDGFNHMVEDCLAGRIDLVLTKSISRFARNTVDTVATIRKLKDKGVAVYFEKENIFTTDSKGEFLLTVMSSLAQEESRSISENVTWGHRKRFADGKVSLAYSRFLGYDKGADKYTMVVNKEQAKIVRRIFRMFLQGYTPHTIGLLLTAEGVAAPGGGKIWNQQTLRRMLSNEKYKGDALLQKEFTVDYLRKKLKKNEGELPQYYIKDDHEPIISPWLFDYVQKLFDERKQQVGEGRYCGIGVLHSKLFCSGCSRALLRRNRYYPKSREVAWWQCRSHTRKLETNCKVKSVYEKQLLFSIHDMARSVAIKHGILDDVLSIMSAEKHQDIKRWMEYFKRTDATELSQAAEDIMMVIRRINVTADRKLKFEWIDRTRSTYHLSKYIPAKGVRHYDN